MSSDKAFRKPERLPLSSHIAAMASLRGPQGSSGLPAFAHRQEPACRAQHACHHRAYARGRNRGARSRISREERRSPKRRQKREIAAYSGGPTASSAAACEGKGYEYPVRRPWGMPAHKQLTPS